MLKAILTTKRDTTGQWADVRTSGRTILTGRSLVGLNMLAQRRVGPGEPYRLEVFSDDQMTGDPIKVFFRN